jgi:hypothetical protein
MKSITDVLRRTVFGCNFVAAENKENVSSSSPAFIFHGLFPCHRRFPYHPWIASADVEHSSADFSPLIDLTGPAFFDY